MRYKLFLAFAFIIPAMCFGIIIESILSLDKSLIKMEGHMKSFKSLNGGARSNQINIFSLEEYPTEFKRSYSGLARINSVDRSRDLFDAALDTPDPYDYPLPRFKNKQERKVHFYILGIGHILLNRPNEKITYFNLKFQTDPYSRSNYYLDLYSYILNERHGLLFTFISFLLTIFSIGFASPAYNQNNFVKAYTIFIVVFHLILFVF